MAFDCQLSVAVLYDTSFLMNGGAPLVIDAPFARLDEKRNRSWNVRTVGITHILGEEVKREIHGHFADAEKIQASRSARKAVAEIIAVQDTTATRCRCEEIMLASAATEHTFGDVLGADSRTDRLLVGYAKRLAENAVYDCIYVATEDGGIMVDVNKLRAEQQLNIHCISSRAGPNITELIISTAPVDKREYKIYAIDLPGLLWKKMFG